MVQAPRFAAPRTSPAQRRRNKRYDLDVLFQMQPAKLLLREQPAARRLLKRGVRPALVPADAHRLEFADRLVAMSPKRWRHAQAEEFGREVKHDYFVEHHQVEYMDDLANHSLHDNLLSAPAPASRLRMDALLVKRMVRHKPIDTPTLYVDYTGAGVGVTGHEGRHRVHLAEQLGVERVPTIIAPQGELLRTLKLGRDDWSWYVAKNPEVGVEVSRAQRKLDAFVASTGAQPWTL